MSTLDQMSSGCFASTRCVRPSKVGKRSPQAKRPLNGVQTLGWVTVESRGVRALSVRTTTAEQCVAIHSILNEFVCAD